jgi:hypothetical protein
MSANIPHPKLFSSPHLTCVPKPFHPAYSYAVAHIAFTASILEKKSFKLTDTKWQFSLPVLPSMLT